MSNELALLVQSSELASGVARTMELVDEYRQAYKDGNAKKAEKQKSLILTAASRFEATSVAYKVLVGALMEPVRELEDPDEYKRACAEFGREPDTVNRYIRVWSAWFSGRFLYNLPKGFNPLLLSLKNLDYGAGLIMEGELDEERARILFGNGDWLTKREMIRQKAEEIEENGGPVSKMRRRNKKGGRKTRINTDGEIWYEFGSESTFYIGFLEINNSDSRIQALALRCKQAILDELR